MKKVRIQIKQTLIFNQELELSQEQYNKLNAIYELERYSEEESILNDIIDFENPCDDEGLQDFDMQDI